jgi:signal transduction histidine kinase
MADASAASAAGRPGADPAGPRPGRPGATSAGAASPGATSAGPRSWLGRLARPVVSAQTWLELIHLMSGTLTGALAFAVIVPLTVAGVGILWFFLAGLPVLLAMLWVCLQFGRLERARFALLLGTVLAAPPSRLDPAANWWGRTGRLLAAPATRRHFGYAVIRLPLSLAEAVLAAGAWSFGVAMLGLPLFSWGLFEVQWHAGGALEQPAVWGMEAAGLVAGLAALAGAPHLTHALATADAALARYLIGPGGRDDMTQRIGELERSRARVVDAAEAERRRIERDLHDGAQQRLVSLAMNLGRARARFATDPEGTRAIIDQAHAEAKEALAELRSLVRGVHPPVLADRGLDAALSGLAAVSPVPVAVHADVHPRPSAAVEAIAYIVVAEALTNVAKHARASQARVSVTRHGDLLRVSVRDDGAGGADPAGQGLAGLADRIAGVDGRLSVRSPAGGPTVIEAELPCGS